MLRACAVHIRNTCVCVCVSRMRMRARGRGSLENASALNRRASNRTRRGARQPADTIVTGCINPPSWYPQGRASNPKVNALDSHRLPSAASSSSTSSLTSFSGPLSPSSPSPQLATYFFLSFSLPSRCSCRYRARARARFLSLSLAGEMENLIWPRAGCHCH